MRHYKRLHRHEGRAHARFLTFSCYNRLPLLQNDAIKRVFVQSLERARAELQFLLLAWVIMPEHVHLLIRPRPAEGAVARLLQAIKQPVAQRVLARWRRLDAPILGRVTDGAGAVRFWLPGGGYDRNVYSDHEFGEKRAYIHRNPVTRGLVMRPIDWPWSSARWYAGMREGQVVIDRTGFPSPAHGPAVKARQDRGTH